MKHDAPAMQDEFGRRSFATQLAHALSAPRQGAGGFVVALDGAWGSGKTTLLNWIKEDLEKSDPAPVPRQSGRQGQYTEGHTYIISVQFYRFLYLYIFKCVFIIFAAYLQVLD